MKKLPLLIITVTLLFSSCSVNKHTAKKNASTGTATFLLISDIHLDTFTDSSRYGNDTGLGLWKIFLAKTDSLLGSSNAPAQSEA